MLLHWIDLFHFNFEIKFEHYAQYSGIALKEFFCTTILDPRLDPGKLLCQNRSNYSELLESLFSKLCFYWTAKSSSGAFGGLGYVH